MPEGHLLHRLARLHRAALRGRTVVADSPQGRFATGATVLDGQRLVTVDAHGKHLLYRWSRGNVLHVHLGLYGGFRSYLRDAPEAALPPASPNTRLRLVADEVVLHLAGPTACDLVDPAQEEALLARLGPDPLRRDADPERAWAALRRRAIPIGAALLDQSVVSGIGNIWRAELLFLAGVSPHRPARDVTRDEFDRLWTATVALLREAERSGRIASVDPADVGRRSRARLPASERLYVYGRAGLPCRRCGTPLVTFPMAARTMFACPTCQAR